MKACLCVMVTYVLISCLLTEKIPSFIAGVKSRDTAMGFTAVSTKLTLPILSPAVRASTFQNRVLQGQWISLLSRLFLIFGFLE